MRGGMEAIYDDVRVPLGFARFAPMHPARGPMFSARQRLGQGAAAATPAPVSEEQFYRP